MNKYDLLALTPSSEVKPLRLGKYPPLRGTAFIVGNISYLYTSGYLWTLKAYLHGARPLIPADRGSRRGHVQGSNHA